MSAARRDTSWVMRSTRRIAAPKPMRPSSPPRRSSSPRPKRSSACGAPAPSACGRRRILPTAEEFRRWAQKPPAVPRRHAFLVGCPRSGTTLLERMLGSHPQVASSSESTVWHSAVWMPLLREFAGVSGMRSLLAELTAARIEAARDRYWRDIGQTVEKELGDRLLLDKNPSIFPVLAGAVRLFPDARILVALRDPRDIVWSCFTQALPINAATAAFLRLESAAEQVAAELEQWLQLRPRLATPWLEVRYERLVEQPDVELKRVLSFLGVPWSPEVMAFHERRDPVRSPTYAAVARPVHKEAVGRWRRYAGALRAAGSAAGRGHTERWESHEPDLQRRLVRSAAAWVVASELANRRGKGGGAVDRRAIDSRRRAQPGRGRLLFNGAAAPGHLAGAAGAEPDGAGNRLLLGHRWRHGRRRRRGARRDLERRRPPRCPRTPPAPRPRGPSRRPRRTGCSSRREPTPPAATPSR